MISRIYQPRHDRGVLTTGQAARICRCGQQTIIRAIDRGILKGFRLPGSTFRRVMAESLREYLVKAGMDTEPLDRHLALA